MKKMLRNVVLTFFGLVSIFILSNCQIGLGAAVDVQPPTVSLTSPQADALVRDVFIIEGTYEDDLSVSEVLVSLKEVTTEVEHKELKAVVTPASENELTKGTWSCSINPKELGILDGTYVATVSAMDTYLHTGTATQTFSIDNTAPLIVLTSPSSTTLDNPTSYGQVFSVEGKAADDSDVDSIDAIIYDENGVEVAKKTITNVSTQIQIDVATWGGGEDDFYKLIYGNNQEAGTKKYQLGFVAYDGARKVPAVEGDRGNSTSVFYMNNDFAEIDGFKTSIAYNLLNGTRAATDPYVTWKKALDEKKVEKATFSLNPINNPYFDVQSYEPVGTVNEKGETVIDLEVETYAFMNKNKLTVNLYVGRDKKAIKTETVGIYLLPCDRYGKLLPNEPKVTLLAPHKDKDGKEIGANNTAQITTVGSTSYKWTSDAIEAQKIEGLNIGKYYLFDVVAYDYNGVGIRNDNKYGIKMVSTSAAPIIQVTEPGATKSVANSSSFVVKGTVKTAADIVNIKAYKNSEESENNIVSGPFVPSAEAKDDAAALAVSEGIVLNKTQTTDALKWYNYSFTVPAIQEESFSILVFATDSNGQSSSKEIVVTNDKKAPEFDKTASITPYVDVVEKDASGNEVTVQKVNGIINITQLISDDTQVEQVWYYVGTDYPTNENSWSEYLGTPKTTLKIQNLDTTQYTKDTNGKRNDIKIYLKAKDKAGNYVGNDSSKSLFIPLNIDQSTDAPQIKFSNLKEIEDDVKAVSITTETGEVKLGIPEDKLETAKNKATVFSTKGNLSIIGSIVDDDGIDKVEVYYCQGSQWDENNKKQLINAEVKGSTTYNLNKELRKDDGNAFEQDVYLLKFIVTDSAGHETGYSSKTIDPFLVAVDDGAPTLEIKTASGIGVWYAGDVTVEGTMDDSSAKLYRYTDEACTQNQIEVTTFAEDGKTWTDTIKIEEGQASYKYWYKAIDSYKQESIKEFNFNYDKIPPRFTITEIQGEQKDYTENVSKFGNLIDYFTVKGKVQDDWAEDANESNTSGLGSYFYYYVGNVAPTSTNGMYSPLKADKTTNAGWNTCTIKKQEVNGKLTASWESAIKFSNVSSGDKLYVCFAAIDEAGNISIINDNPSAILQVTIDTDAPEISGAPVLTQSSDSTTIKVLAKDDVAGLNVGQTSISRNGKEIILTNSTPNEVEENGYKALTYTIVPADLDDGKNEFVITVKDNFGYTTKANPIIINNFAPKISNIETSIPTTATKRVIEGKEYTYIKDSFVISADITCAEEGNKLGIVEWNDTNNQTGTLTGTNGKYTTPAISNFDVYKDQLITRTISAKNIYGKESIYTINFAYDEVAPRFGITKIKNSPVTGLGMSSTEDNYSTVEQKLYGSTKNEFVIEGTASDEWSGQNKNNASGAKFYYYVGTEPLTPTDNNTYSIFNDDGTAKEGWTDCSIAKDGSWKISLSFDSYNSGDKLNLYFAAVDGVGNISQTNRNPSANIKIVIDDNPPMFGTPIQPSFDNSKTTISVKVKDIESSIDDSCISVTCNGNSANLGTVKKSDTADEEGYYTYTWTPTNESLKTQLSTGDNTIYITMQDNAGNKQQSNAIIIKNKAPAFTDKTDGVSSGFRFDEYYYVNDAFETYVTVKCCENNFLKQVSYTDIEHINEKTKTPINSKPEFSFASDVLKISKQTDLTVYENKLVERTITAENIYGQTTTWSFMFKVDSVAPVIKTGTSITIDGKSAVNDWFNKTTLPISGTYTENGSGVKQVTYKLTNGSGTVVESNGSIYTTDKGDEEEFVANIGGFTEGKNPNFLDFIATDNARNTSENTQFLNIRIDTTAPKLLATVAPDEAENTTSNIVWYRFVDETEWKKLENSILTNKTKDVELTGAFEDINEGNLQSGVREIKINVNNNQIDAKVYSKSEGEWSVPSGKTTGFEPNDENNSIQSGCWFARIPATSLSNSDCTAEIKIKDNAGNEGNPEKVNFRVDITAPKVTIEMPSANSTLNGLNTFSGKVNDANDVKSIKLYYAFKETDTAPTTFEKYQELATNVQADTKTLLKKVVGENNVSLSDVTSWKFEEVDVNKILPSEKVKGNLFILPVAYDKAGNNNISGTAELEEDTSVSGKATKVIIDLHSDRPIIKFTNLSWKDGTYEKYLNATTLNASIEDDDGIKEVKVAIAEGEDVTARPDWKTQTVTSSSIKIELEDDGPKTIWLYVKDAAGGEFETSSTKITVENASQPYLLFDGNETKQHNEDAISITRDTIKPIIGTMAYGFASDGTTATSNAKGTVSAENPTKFNLGTTNFAGGTKRKYVVFEIPVTEGGSGVASVTMSVDGMENPYTLNEDKGKYYTNPIDVSSWTEGDKDLTFTVKDKAGLEDIKTKRITIDNSGPVSKLTNPTEDTTTGIVTLSGYSTDNGSGVVKTTRYVVFDNNFYSKENTLKSDLEKLVYETLFPSDETLSTPKFYNSGTEYNWSFVLDGNPKESSVDKVNAKLPANEDEVANYSYVPHPNDIYTMSVCIYSEDDLGNKSYLFDDFKYNPFGDRPIANITYPMGKAYGTGKVDVTDYPNLCDMITVQGAATDNKSMETGKVWLQIDMNNDGKFGEDDITALSGTGKYTITEGIDAIKVTDKDGNPIQITIDDSALDTDTLGTEDFWGIETTGTNNWSISINVSNELQTATFDEATKENTPLTGTFIGNNKYKVGIRAVAMDSSGVMGRWSTPSYFLIDVNAPEIGIASFGDRTYSEDMFLSGEQTFKVTVSDIAGIKKVSYSWANSINELALSGVSNGEVEPDKPNVHGEKFARLTPWPEANNTNGRKNYDLEIPVTSLAGVGEKLALKIVAYKDSLTNTTENAKYVVNFDNNAPTLQSISLNGVLYNETTNSKIVNSNGYFSLGGTITENNDSDSGFEKLAFYYLREGQDENSKRIYNPMEDSVTDKDAGRINISGLSTEELGKENEKLPIYGKNVSSITITNDANKQSSFTIPTISNSDFIGLVKIGNSWHSVKSVSGTTITLKSYVPDGTYENVFLGYVQVVDNTGAEFMGENGTITGDDGDGMEESIIPDGRTWTCNAKITSHYIPDGPGKLVVFAFDKAGNVVSDDYDASVQNNAPRLTRVMLATDLNGDGSYEYESATIRNDKTELATPNGTEFGEFVYYSTLNSMGEAVNIANITVPTGAEFVVKNNLLVVPEFVGGNYDSTKKNQLAYTYKIVDELTEATVTTFTGNGAPLLLENSTRLLAKTKTEVKNPINNQTETGVSKEFEIKENDLTDYESLTTNSDGTETRGVKYLAATFWDETEETTQGVNSCYALLKMPIVIDVVDDKKPTAHIIPFYWNSKEDSSFVYDDDGNPLGHIDIEAEPRVDTRPGVSGEVYIEGEARDDTMLGEIWITEPSGSSYKVASYSKDNESWTIETPQANAKWKSFEPLDTPKITQSGHTIKWRLRIDMSSYGISTNEVVFVEAKDAESNRSTGITDDDELDNVISKTAQTIKGKETPKYVMDFVPYIKSIYSTAVGSATRSRLGKFPVRAGELMTIEGMNFNGGTGATYKVNFYKSNDDGKPSSEEVDKKQVAASIDTNGNIIVDAPDYSRWVEVEVTLADKTKVSTKNNSNQNGGYNIEAGYVANDKGLSQANTAGTNFWTDDRYISVWKVGTGLPGSMTPHSGVVKKISIENSGGDTVGGGYMYKQPEGLTQVDSISNTNNHYYAALSSDDLKVYGYVGPKEYVSHGDNVIWNGSEACFQVPIDAMDMTIINGLPYYVMQDSFLSGDSANVWGPGLFISREGAGWNRDKLSKHGQTLEEETCYFIIERQGTSDQKAANRATMEANLIGSKDGYDAILKQFKNPKIVGYYDSTESLYYTDANSGQRVTGVDYVYVSYYDSHSKCLKYAAYKVGHRFNNNKAIEWIDMYQWGYHNERADIVPLMHSAKHNKSTAKDDNGTKDSNNMITGNAVVAGWDSLQASPTIKEKAGEWSDIMIDPTTKYPVIIYYNETKRSLEVAFGNSQAPSTGQICSTEGEFSAENTTAWTKTKGITPNSKIDFGRYVSAEMDKNGNIHATAQDVTNNKLYYIFLKKNVTSYSSTFKVVDSTAAVGMWTDIQLKNSAGDTNGNWYGYGPTISYMNKEQLNSTNAIKIAYCSSDGTWESITDPTSYPGLDQKTSVMVDVYEGGTVDSDSKSVTSNGVKAQIGVGFNSDMYILDFLRGEE